MIIEKTLVLGIACTLRSFTAINTALIGANENHYSMQLKHDTPNQSMQAAWERGASFLPGMKCVPVAQKVEHGHMQWYECTWMFWKKTSVKCINVMSTLYKMCKE